MPGTYDGQIRSNSVLGSKEIKASAVYTHMLIGGTLDGTKFAAGATILEGQCLARKKSNKLYEPYNQGTAIDAAGVFPSATYDNPVILDQSIKLEPIAGVNPNVIFGQALVTGAVYEQQLVGSTAGFKAAMPQIRFVNV